MRRPIAFAEVLEEKLSGCAPAPPVSPKPAFGHVPTVRAFVFEFGAAAIPVREPQVKHLYSVNPGPPPRSEDPPSYGGARESCDARPLRSRRVLSPQGQAAVVQLNTLGAAIGPDFTDQELRHAFRALARRYHPDRHPGCSTMEKARLSRQFIQLHDAYRALQVASPIAA
jgi:hypothetical protein